MRGPDGRELCGNFLRRIRPQGISVVCQKAATRRVWAIHDDGREVRHAATCPEHLDRYLRCFRPAQGWRIVVRDEVNPSW